MVAVESDTAVIPRAFGHPEAGAGGRESLRALGDFVGIRKPTVTIGDRPDVLAGTGTGPSYWHANSGLNAAEYGCLCLHDGPTFARRRPASNPEGTF
jgi:hypothetical protein